MDNKTIDRRNLTPEQVALLDQYKTSKEQLQVLSDIAVMSQELIHLFDDLQSRGKQDSKSMGALLTDMRESLASLNAKEAPEMPDYAKPIVASMSKLEKAVVAAVKAMPDVKVDIPKIEAPQVTVDSPNIDLSGIEKIIKADIPKAFKDAIGSIPKPVRQDNSDMLSRLDEMLVKLAEIDTGVRMKPQPGTMKVTNPDGSSIGSIPAEVEITNDTGNPIPVIESSSSVIDSNNSTTTTLGSGASFTGTSTDVSGYEAVYVTVFSDKASATNGLKFQGSPDGTNWDHEHTYTYDGGSIGLHYEETLAMKYFRVVYTNTNSAQTTFRLQTKLLKNPATAHVHPIDYTIDTNHPAAVVRSVITGQTTAGGGGLVNVKVSPSGTLETNANIRVGGSDVSNSVPVPISDAGGSLTVDGTITANAGTGTFVVGDGGGSLTVDGTVAATQSGTWTVSSETFTKKSVTASSSGNNTIHTPAAGKKIRLYFFGYSAGSDVTGVLCALKFGTAGTVFDRQYLSAAGQPYARNIQAGKRYVDGAVDEVLVLNLSAAQTIYTNVELEEI